jgi:hypothetical protein
MHHLFSECPVFLSFRMTAVSGLCSRTKELLEDKASDALQGAIIDFIPFLFSPQCSSHDSHFWPHGANLWYLGHIPFIHRRFPALSSRCASALGHVWHSGFIHLTGRIWGFILGLGGDG